MTTERKKVFNIFSYESSKPALDGTIYYECISLKDISDFPLGSKFDIIEVGINICAWKDGLKMIDHKFSLEIDKESEIVNRTRKGSVLLIKNKKT